jgi:amino acid adenylation domain-containing protein
LSQLSYAQAALLEKLSRGKIAAISEKEFPRVLPDAQVPLLPAQARLWFLTRKHPDSGEHSPCEAIELSPAPGREHVETAFRTLMERHDALRLRVTEVDGALIQEDRGLPPLPLTWYDLRALPDAEADSRSREIIADLARNPISPDQAPLFRVRAIQLPGDRLILTVSVHHVVIDNWSFSQLTQELGLLLSGRELPPACPVRFLDYAAARTRELSQDRLGRELSYWTSRLGGELPVLDLPADRPRPATEDRSGRLARFTVPPTLTRRLRALAEEASASLNVVLLAAYNALLMRLTSQRDLIVGIPLDGRDHPVAERIVGCFVQTVALRTDLTGEPSFLELVRRVQEGFLEAQDYRWVPFDRVVAELGIPRIEGVNPVFQTLFTYYKGASVTIGETRNNSVVQDNNSARADLSLLVSDSGQTLDGLLAYATALFDHATVERIGQMYLHLLDAIVNDPGSPVDSMPLIPVTEQQRLTHDLHAYERPDISYHTLAETVEEQVRRTPDATALAGDEGELSYAELNARANQLACYLRSRGAGPGSLVAVCSEHGFDMVIAVYAVAKTGAAYLPLDPELPSGHLGFMLEDTQPLLVLAGVGPATKIPDGAWQVVSLSGDRDQWASLSQADVPAGGVGNALAFLRYPSGSAGRPKAVSCPVDTGLADIFYLQRKYPYGSGDATILGPWSGFDMSVWELFWPLCSGATLVTARSGGERDLRHLVGLIERHQVTTMSLAPTMMEAFLEHVMPGECASLRWVLCGGEAVRPRLRDAFHARLGAEMIHWRGPAEVGMISEGVVPRDRDTGSPVVPPGRPCGNFRLYVLGPDLEVLPVGVPGELFVGGAVGLAHGYHNRPALTASHFMPDPFGAPGERMYRTGDLCRFRPDGVLEHHGRIGRQLRIRGIRTEPGEIEAVLCEHPDILECVVLAPSSLEGQIAAFVVIEPDTYVTAADLIRHARQLLPAHLVPAAVIPVERIPFTVNGDLDQETLTALLDSTADATAEWVEPCNDLERDLLAIFASTLRLESISVTDSFFDMGGHSLLVFKLVAECAAQLSLYPTVTDVFAAPSVRQLAELLADDTADRKHLVPLAIGAGKPIIALIHGAGGLVSPFRALASALGGDYEVLGLQMTEADGAPDSPPLTIEELATRYAEELAAARGPRPLFLIGWSVGGCVALEMARRWQETEWAAAGTLLLDTWLPPAAIGGVAGEQARQAFRAMDLLAGESSLRGMMADAPEEAALVDTLLERNRQAFLDYLPERFTGRVHLLRAAEPYPDPQIRLPRVLLDGDYGWSSRLSDIAISEIPGSHYSLLSDDNSAALAHTISGIADSLLTFHEI